MAHAARTADRDGARLLRAAGLTLAAAVGEIGRVDAIDEIGQRRRVDRARQVNGWRIGVDRIGEITGRRGGDRIVITPTDEEERENEKATHQVTSATPTGHRRQTFTTPDNSTTDKGEPIVSNGIRKIAQASEKARSKLTASELAQLHTLNQRVVDVDQKIQRYRTAGKLLEVEYETAAQERSEFATRMIRQYGGRVPTHQINDEGEIELAPTTTTNQ